MKMHLKCTRRINYFYLLNNSLVILLLINYEFHELLATTNNLRIFYWAYFDMIYHLISDDFLITPVVIIYAWDYSLGANFFVIQNSPPRAF